MTRFIWSAGTTGDWSTTDNWSPTGTPGAGTPDTDVAVLGATSTGPGTTYTVTLDAGSTFDLARLRLFTGHGVHSFPSLTVGGNLLTDTLAYAGGGPADITVSAGGLFDIRTNIYDAGSAAQTITIAGTGGGGHLEFGNTSVDNSNVTTSFANTSATTLNTGEIEFLSGFVAMSTATSQQISNLAWGDQIVFDGADFTGDVATLDTSTGVLTVTDGSSTILTMNNVGLQTGAQNDLAVFGDTIEAVCFAAGTRILTATGERMIETLIQGDIVLTLAGDELSPKPVKWVGRRRIDLMTHPRPETVAPIRIQRSAFADNVPHTDLLVSPDHAILVDGRLICARQLINGTTIRQETGLVSAEYFHVELEAHAILLAEGLPAESYLNTGNGGFFANSKDPLVLHPDLTDETDYPTREAGSCAPFVWDEANVRPIWQRLAERAAMLGQPVRPVEASDDPALHIVAAGRKLRPVHADTGRFIFVLPRNAGTVQLVSRASAPTDVRPWLEDRRRLGVCLARIVLRDATQVWEIPMDHPDLQEGWWAVERDGWAIRRWTDGKAVLPLPATSGVTMLELHLCGGMDYVTPRDERREAA
ncbi:MAG: Hint domain-containing protein [Acetobacteraceae bacterium]